MLLSIHRRRRTCLGLGLFIFVAYYSMLNRRKTFVKNERENIKRMIDSQLESNLKYDKRAGCVMPKSDPFDQEIMKFQQKRPQIVCNGFDWVRCNMSICRVRAEIFKQFHNVSCDYWDLIRDVPDNTEILGKKVSVRNNSVYELVASDYTKVLCIGTSHDEITTVTWHSWVHGLRKMNNQQPVTDNNEKNDSTPFNILILAFDSVAKNAFIRLMPKSYKTLQNDMDAIILNGYNIVGDGTPAAMFPILTGYTELQLPDRRKKFSKETMDDLPFIFYKLKKHGYRTAYFEDLINKFDGTFQYRFTGFRRPPADHYMRPYFSAFNNKKWNDMRKFCYGDTPAYQLLFNASEQLFNLPGKKFLLTFISDITHDDIYYLTSADGALERFLKDFKEKGHLNDTMLIVMGDHGTRFGSIRQTYLGKLEERHPLMAIMLPERLKIERPSALKALKDNVEVLTTPHDVHATLLDVMNLKQYWNPMKIPGADMTRALTLLESISPNRSCSEAGIESHWCTCITWENVPSNDSMFNRTSQALVDYINNVTKPYRSHCVERSLDFTYLVQRSKVRRELLKYGSQSGIDGYVGLFTGNTAVDKETYFVKIEINPGHGVFEATVMYTTSTKEIHVNDRSISRINAYSDQPSCIREKYPHLNMFCFCKQYL